jgi:hypothetical protein
MQNVYFNEVEAVYMRHRVQDAVAASGLAAQATACSIRNRRRFYRSLVLVCLRAREVLGRRRPVLQPLPCGKELQAAQG